jgi:HSP20 family protein
MAEKEKSVKHTGAGEAAPKGKETIVPAVDICEDKERVLLLADLPGVGKDGLDLHVDKDTLHINGNRSDAGYGTAQDDYREMPPLNYYRAFTISDEIDRDKISASMNSGVLKVVLPKSERVKPKKIDIAFS